MPFSQHLIVRLMQYLQHCKNRNAHHNESLTDGILPEVRVGIALGEIVIADGTLTGPNVVIAQRIEQLAERGEVCIQGTVYETIPRRLPFEFTSLGEQKLKGFDKPAYVYTVRSKPVKRFLSPIPNYQPVALVVRSC